MPERLTEEQVQSIVTAEIESSRAWGESLLAPARSQARKYYRGEPFGDEKEGRSQIRTRELRDTVRGILPSLLRIFWGGERAVEYAPRREEDVPVADQVTDYVNEIVLQQDNPGFVIFHSWFKDAAMMSPGGIVKWWWEDEPEILEVVEYEGIPLETWVALLSKNDVEEIDSEIDPATGIISGSIRHIRPGGRVRVMVVPPEEFGFSADARSIGAARCIYHQREITVSEAVSMGYDFDGIEEFIGAGNDDAGASVERAERDPQYTYGMDAFSSNVDAGGQRILYTEALIRLDEDGDGRAELRKYCCMGPGHTVMRSEHQDHVNFAILSPDPEPHSPIGLNYFDIIHDLQFLNSHLWRAMLDSAGFSLFPRTAVVETMVRMEDVLDGGVGQPIRMKMPGAVQELSHTFMGIQLLPVMEAVKTLRQERTGQTDLSQGTGPEMLQSTTRMAVNAAVTAAQAQMEVLARIFAETGVKDLFVGILRTLAKHPEEVKNRVVRLRNTWVELDPRTWDLGMDVKVNVALGGGLQEERQRRYEMIAAKQEQIFATLGPDNPLVSIVEYRHTLAKMLEVGGEKNVSAFFKAIPPDWTPPPPPPPPPDPNMVIAEAEKMRAEVSLQEAKDKMQLEMLKLRLLDDRERDKMAITARLEAMKAGQALDIKAIDLMLRTVEPVGGSPNGGAAQ